LGRRAPFGEAAAALAAGFAVTLNVQLEPDVLSAGELERTQAIRAEKYANDSWTRRVGAR
jgi:lipoate-protein ligase A